MKNAPIQKSNESARVITGILAQGELFGDVTFTKPFVSPHYPPTRDSVIAHVLADLLEGKKIDTVDLWFDGGGSYRAATYAHRLIGEYDWPIQKNERCVATSDGRTENVTQYFLKPDVISIAFQFGADNFIRQVRPARAKRRLTVKENHRKAQAVNSARAKAKGAA